MSLTGRQVHGSISASKLLFLRTWAHCMLTPHSPLAWTLQFNTRKLNLLALARQHNGQSRDLSLPKHEVSSCTFSCVKCLVLLSNLLLTGNFSLQQLHSHFRYRMTCVLHVKSTVFSVWLTLPLGLISLIRLVGHHREICYLYYIHTYDSIWHVQICFLFFKKGIVIIYFLFFLFF